MALLLTNVDVEWYYSSIRTVLGLGEIILKMGMVFFNVCNPHSIS